MEILKLYVSNYVILGRNKDDDYILIHSYLGNVDILEKKYGDVLIEHRKNKTEIECSEIPEDIYEQLAKKGYIVKDVKRDEEIYQRLAEKIKEVSQRKKDIYTLIPSYECNFRCSYCFELDVVGKKDNNKQMKKELVDVIFKNIDESIKQKRQIKIVLFGGEPLLKNNKNINTYICNLASQRNIKLSAVSNGYDIDSYVDLFEKGYFKNVQITLDGDEKVHDSRRYRIGKLPTFKKIIDNIDKVLNIENGPNIIVRINVNKHNYDSISDLYNIFKSKDWLDNKKFNFYTKSVHACYESVDEKIYDTDVITNVKLSKDVLENMSFNVTYKNMIDYIKSVLSLNSRMGKLRTGACGAVNGMKVIDAYGDIYACYEKVNSKQDRIGYIDLDSEKFVYNDKKDLWMNRQVQNLNKCSKCSYSLICGGNCAQHGKVCSGDLHEPCCDDVKEIVNKVLLELSPTISDD